MNHINSIKPNICGFSEEREGKSLFVPRHTKNTQCAITMLETSKKLAEKEKNQLLN
jgi:hypothetical protein